MAKAPPPLDPTAKVGIKQSLTQRKPFLEDPI